MAGKNPLGVGQSLKEWSVKVPKRWWDLIAIPLTYVPILVGVIFFEIWANTINPALVCWIQMLVVGGVMLFGILSFMAFHRVRVERDKACKKPPRLSNRESLIRAIGNYQTTANNLIKWQRELDDNTSNDDTTINIVKEVEKALTANNQAWDNLWNERLIAGDAFEVCIKSITSFVLLQLLLGSGTAQIGGNKPLRLGVLEFTGQLAGRVVKAIDTIDSVTGANP